MTRAKYTFRCSCKIILKLAWNKFIFSLKYDFFSVKYISKSNLEICVWNHLHMGHFILIVKFMSNKTLNKNQMLE